MQDLSRYVRKDHIEIQTRYISFLLAGSVVLAGLVFALGVLVGSRRQIQEPSTCLQPDPLAALDRKSGEPAPPAQPPVPLSFHDTLPNEPDRIPISRSFEGSNQPVASGDAVHVATLRQPPAEEPLVPDVGGNHEPGSYSLQVGSFQELAEANEMVRRLERTGHPAFLVSVQMPERGGRWYRVRVGPFKSNAEAWKYKAMFEKKERLPAFVVRKTIVGGGPAT